MIKKLASAIILIFGVCFQVSFAAVPEEHQHEKMCNLLLSAAQKKDDQEFATLLDSAQQSGLALTLVQDSGGNTLLHLLVNSCRKDMIDMILSVIATEQDQYINKKNKKKMSALDCAVICSMQKDDQEFEIAELLIENGAKFNINSICASVLGVGSMNRKAQRFIFNKILSDPECMSNFSKYRNILIYFLLASKLTNSEVLELLRKLVRGKGSLEGVSSSWDKKNYFKGNPLDCALRFHRFDPLILSFLLSKGIDPNDLDRQGFSPFHRACSDGSSEVVKILLAGGTPQCGLTADPCLPNEYDETPLMLASNRPSNTDESKSEKKRIISLITQYVNASKNVGNKGFSNVLCSADKGCSVQ